VLHKEANRHT